MPEPLPTYQTTIHALDPTRADIRIRFDSLAPGVEARGRLMGPRCPGVSTVEVSYRLQAMTGEPSGTYQVLIPEPNLWAPEHPFRYEGPVEFWRDGVLIATITVSVGIRAQGV
jgi:hypothetical protein